MFDAETTSTHVRTRLRRPRVSRAAWRAAFSLVLCWAAIAGIPALAGADGEPAPVTATETLDARLERLVERLEERQAEHHIPGMSLVVVKDDAVVLSRGFGVYDHESGAAVDTKTPFLIGSTTKAFTATLVGMLVDEGKMEWDAPIATYIPYFDPEVDSESDDARVTVRDALSHRSGFSRMGMLVMSSGLEPREVLEVANRAKPYDGYHQGFHYNNILYLAAGTASAEAADTNWHRLLKKRLLKPLGMKATTSTAASIRARAHTGYRWDDDTESIDDERLMVIDTAAPAGSIVSTADDMGRWIRFLLAGGELDGKRLIREETLRETWESNVDIAEGIGYGMGWMLRDWSGRKVVEHGGNVNGYSTAVGLIPEENLGFALMLNVSVTPLQQECLTIVWSAMLGEAAGSDPASGDEGSAEDLAALTGEYIANFGPFQDATMAVTEKDGRLFVDIPGQMNFELSPPNEEGRRPFAMTDTIAVSFQQADDGTVELMRIHQSGFDFEVPREGYEYPVEIDLAELEPYLGKYRSENRSIDVPVVVNNNHLAVDMPDQFVAELHLPDDDGRWKMRVRSEMSFSFDRDENDRVVSMTLRRGDDTVETLPRLESGEEVPLPSIDDLIALRATAERSAGLERLAEGVTVKMTGKIHHVHAGLEGRATQWFDRETARVDHDFGKFGWTSAVLSPDGGRMATSTLEPDDIPGRMRRAMYQMQIVVTDADWCERFEKVRVLKRLEGDDRTVVLVRLENPDAPAVSAHVDPENGDVVRIESAIPITGAGGELPISIDYGDFRDVDGVRVPFRSSTENHETGVAVVEFEEIEFLEETSEGWAAVRS